MKMCRFLILLGIVSLLGGQSLFAQAKNADKAQQVKTEIDGGNYRIDVLRALPMGGRTVNLTSPYGVELKGDSIYSHLPYYGRAYSIPYGGGDGLIFQEPVSNYTVKYDEKNKATITFTARSDEDRYDFRIEIFSNGSASLFVQPGNRQSINYQGNLVLKEEE